MKTSLFIALAGFALTSAQADEIAQTSKPPMSQPQPNCSALSMDEQTFASSLNLRNQMMFCTQFNMDQRTNAMQMAGQMDANGNMMTGDQAVMQVAQDNNLMMPTPGSQPNTGGSRGGCPVPNRPSN